MLLRAAGDLVKVVAEGAWASGRPSRNLARTRPARAECRGHCPAALPSRKSHLFQLYKEPWLMLRKLQPVERTSHKL